MACSLGAIKNNPVVKPMFSDTLSSKEVIRIKNSLTDVWYTDNIKFSYFIYMEIYGC